MRTLVVVLSLVAFASAAAPAQSVDITGKWILDVQTDAGSGTPTFTFKQEGEKLSGHYSGQLGEADLTGTVKGDEFSFSFSGEAQGQQFKVTYTGTATKDMMKGTVDLGGMAGGTFTGKRQ
jgi:hypothetical protein